MDGLSRAVGVGPTVTLGGRTLNVKGKVIRCYAEIEAEMIKLRGSPFDYLREIKDIFSDNPEMVRDAIREGFAVAKTWKNVSGEEMAQWLNGTFRGQCFILWLTVRHNNPNELTFEKVSEMYCDELEDAARDGGEEGRAEKKAEIEAAIDQASGDDDLGNSNGPQGAEETVPQPQPTGV